MLAGLFAYLYSRLAAKMSLRAVQGQLGMIALAIVAGPPFSRAYANRAKLMRQANSPWQSHPQEKS